MQNLNSELYLLDSSHLLKLYRPYIDPAAVQYEFEVTQQLYAFGLPCVNALEFRKQQDRCGIVFQKLEAKNLADYCRSKIWAIRRLARKFADLHYDLHQHQVPGLLSQQEVLEKALLPSYRILKPYWTALQDTLATLPQTPQGLCHGDLSPDNVLVYRNKFFVIDWLTAVNGSVLMDVARSYLIILTPATAGPQSTWLHPLIRKMQHYFAENYLDRYLQLSNIKRSALQPLIKLAAASRLAEQVPQEKAWLLRILSGDELSADPA